MESGPIKLMPLQIAYYQFSTESGYVKIELPFSMSKDDADDAVYGLELVIKQVKRRSRPDTKEDR